MMKKFFFLGLKFGLVFNFVSFLVIFAYVYFVEKSFFKPIDSFPLPLELGSIVDSRRLFAADVPSMKIRYNWLKIQGHFAFYVIEYQTRSDYSTNSPRLLKWCQNNQTCFAHRLSYSDPRKLHFDFFTLDDWFANSLMMLETRDIETRNLYNYLQSLPENSTVVISEPFSVFSSPKVFHNFSTWVLTLRKEHPHLKFELGLQIHLQWVDAYWLNKQWVMRSFSSFSNIYSIPWGVSEYSNFDQIWKRRIRLRSPIDRFFYKVEGFIPRRLRRAAVIHATYLIHRDSVRFGATRFVEWGNIQYSAWFVREIDPDYDSNFDLFDSDGNPTPLWWASMRGFRDGKN
jgi:hypothetical protein